MNDETAPGIDRSTEAGARAAERLAHDKVIWLSSVDPDGTPQHSPVWFLWDGSIFLVYSKQSPRVSNIQARPRVGMNLDGNGQGGDIVVVEGLAHIDHSRPSAADNPTYLDKYRETMDTYGWSPEWFADHYPVPIVINPTAFRYW